MIIISFTWFFFFDFFFLNTFIHICSFDRIIQLASEGRCIFLILQMGNLSLGTLQSLPKTPGHVEFGDRAIVHLSSPEL